MLSPSSGLKIVLARNQHETASQPPINGLQKQRGIDTDIECIMLKVKGIWW
jgi:hypothetical protein